MLCLFVKHYYGARILASHLGGCRLKLGQGKGGQTGRHLRLCLGIHQLEAVAYTRRTD
jgi:hypothetical protein